MSKSFPNGKDISSPSLFYESLLNLFELNSELFKSSKFTPFGVTKDSNVFLLSYSLTIEVSKPLDVWPMDF